MSFHRLERVALADALTTAGPGAPTLCEGWRTEHLAAHVVLRERNPLAAAGIGVPFLADRTERATQALGDRSSSGSSYARLVEQVRTGPPGGRWHPLELAGDAAQLLELHVHTEDVRRGGADVGPRPLEEEHVAALWPWLVRMAGPLYRRTRLTVEIEDVAGGRRHVARGRGPHVTVRGEVGELVLHAFGRSRVARVEVAGPDEARRLMLAARPG